jgi:hypothetical protein
MLPSGPQAVAAALCSLLAVGASVANDRHAHRQHDAHVHGVAQLNVVQEGRTLALELTTPAMNIVGFEHPPRTPEQKHAVEEAMATLEKAGELFMLPAEARCEVVRADVETDLNSGHDHKPDHGAHGHGHAHHDEGGDHAEFHAHYEFLCKAPRALRYIDVRVFSLFPATERLDVQLITSRGQTAAVLTPDAARLML